MSEHELLQSVEQARHQLTVLRARLEGEETAPESPELRTALGDILERLERLQARYELLREILAQTSDAVFAKDRGGCYRMINPTGAAMFGRSVEEVVGRDDTALYPRAGAERIMAIDRMILRTGQPQTFEETLLVRGVPITLLTTEAPWYEPRGTLHGVIGSAQDVTERRQAERTAEVQCGRLRSLALEIVITEERSRQSLAAELHKGLGQEIALTRLKLSALRGSSSAELRDPLTRIEHLVEQANRSLRSITYQLSPPALQDPGLGPALRWLAEDVQGRYRLDVRIEDAGSSAVADERVRVILFRAVRELLINAATHAHARTVRMRFGSEAGSLRISVVDNGVGFDASGVDREGHGLFGIREQLKHVGGSMQIDSTPGRGTTVVLTAPRTMGDSTSTR